VARALERDPAKRFASAAELAAALRRRATYLRLQRHHLELGVDGRSANDSDRRSLEFATTHRATPPAPHPRSARPSRRRIRVRRWLAPTILVALSTATTLLALRALAPPPGTAVHHGPAR